MRRVLVVSVGLTALMVGMVVAWYSVRQEREFQRLIAAGDAALAQDQTSGAVEAFSGALALKHDSMLAHLKRGDTYRRRGELDAALRDLRQAAALDPSAPRPLELLGDVNMAGGNYRQAVEHYLSFTQLDDRSPRVLYKLGLAYFRNGQPTEALQPLQHAISLDGRLAEAYYLLGMCQRARSEHDAALKALTRAVEIDGAFVAAREELADLYEQTGRRQQAIEQLEALAALEPERHERLIRAALTYARWGRNETALLTLGRAAERFPDRDDVHIALGRVWLGIAESRGDQAALQQALGSLEPRAARADSSPEALMLYGRAMFLSGDAAAAERALLQATSTVPVNPLAFRYLADAAERLGHVEAAVDALVRYAALVDDREIDPSINARLARLERRLGSDRT